MLTYLLLRKIFIAVIILIILLVCLICLICFTIKYMKDISIKIAKMNAILAAQNKQQDIDPEENQG